MKKILIGIIVALCVWNIVLSYKVYDIENSTVNSNGQTLIKQSATEFDTDVTEAVSDTAAKVVGVTSKSNYSSLNGSGVIYATDDEGVLIITNSHVLNNDGTVYVYFANNIVLEAEVVGKDTISDIALLRVHPEFDVESFTIGDSSLAQIGEWLLLIGNTLGEEYSGYYSLGILSGDDKVVWKDINSDGTEDWDLPLLQLSTQVTSSNTGGAVVNMAGELIGIASSKVTSASSDGIGYAIPIDEVITIVDQLLTNGRVNRTTIGAALKDLSDLPVYLKSYYEIQLDLDGAMVTEIIDSGPADQAGLKVGDVITKIDGQKMTTSKEIREYLAEKYSGDVIEVDFVRNGTENKVSVTLQ